MGQDGLQRNKPFIAFSGVKPRTDEQVFYDKFLYDKFILPSVRVCTKLFDDKFCLLMYNTPLGNVLLGSI